MLKGNVAYQHSEDKDTNEDVPDAPQWQTYLNGHWNFLNKWSLNGQWFWVGDRERTEGDARDDVDNYSMFNVSIRRKDIARHWNAALMVKNLLDKDLYEPSKAFIDGDYPMEGRSVFGEVRFYF